MKKLLALITLSLFASCAPAGLGARMETEITFITSSGQLVDKFVLSGDTHKEHFLRLEKWLEDERGVPVEYTPGLVDLEGYVGATSCFMDVCIIYIDSATPFNNQFNTLLHEATHTFHDQTLHTYVKEVIAETVAYQAGLQVGLNSKVESMSYLTQYPEFFRVAVFSEFEDDINKWARMLAEASSEKKGS